MKRVPRYRIILSLLAAVCFTLPAASQGVRIVSQELHVANDSLHLSLEMDLSSIRMESSEAVSLIPLLAGQRGQVELAPVIVTGKRRYRFDRREWALRRDPIMPPYLVLKQKRKQMLHTIHYQQSIPFSAWMVSASLLLKQEFKACCDPEWLGTDTLVQDLATLIGELPAMPVMAHKPIAPSAPPAPQRPSGSFALPQPELLTFLSRVSFLTPETSPNGKQLAEQAVLYIDYPQGQSEVMPAFRNNRAELDKLATSFALVNSSGLSTVEQIQICGYCSPEGNYQDNERLAANRSRHFASYVCRTYQLPASLITVNSVGEDWEGLQQELRAQQPPYANAALDIIHRYGIFDGRERELMTFQGGSPYRDMLKHLFPQLRRIELKLNYSIRPVNNVEAAELIYTHPELLSLTEMYGVARYYRPGTDQYREVYEIAAYHFPNDVVTNVNAASAVLLTGDLQSARSYLEKVKENPRSWNNLGVLAWMEGDTEAAATWFRRAVGVEPQKARNNLQWIASGEKE